MLFGHGLGKAVVSPSRCPCCCCLDACVVVNGWVGGWIGLCPSGWVGVGGVSSLV